MLHQEVVDAVKAGQFHISAVSTIDEGIEILTCMPMGRMIDGRFPENTISFRVDAMLRQMALKLRKYSGSDNDIADEDKKIFLDSSPNPMTENLMHGCYEGIICENLIS